MREQREGSEEGEHCSQPREHSDTTRAAAAGRGRRYPGLLTSCRTPNDRATPRIAAIHSWASVLALGRSREAGSSGANAKPGAVVQWCGSLKRVSRHGPAYTRGSRCRAAHESNTLTEPEALSQNATDVSRQAARSRGSNLARDRSRGGAP